MFILYHHHFMFIFLHRKSRQHTWQISFDVFIYVGGSTCWTFANWQFIIIAITRLWMTTCYSYLKFCVGGHHILDRYDKWNVNCFKSRCTSTLRPNVSWYSQCILKKCDRDTKTDNGYYNDNHERRLLTRTCRIR